MPRIKLYIATSLDGFIARENGSIDWLTKYENNPETDYGYSEFYASIGKVLMGRKTYEQALGFGEWPYREKKSYVFTRQKESIAAKIMSNSFPRTLGNSCTSSREILRKISGSWAVRRLSKYFLRKTLCRI